MMSVGGWWWCGVDSGCGVGTKVVAARSGEWCGGSSRSGEGECFRGSPEISPEKFSDGGERRQEGGSGSSVDGHDGGDDEVMMMDIRWWCSVGDDNDGRVVMMMVLRWFGCGEGVEMVGGA
uniref:Uncharacterized protein n=1 Tax=Tanacetum cinerariifolium TaxID=118510 RepID=A0A6L2ME20_TANCI|nr:hypothetical protein [Tanacetum cinerariifolium]